MILRRSENLEISELELTTIESERLKKLLYSRVRHFKGAWYNVLGMAKHTETGKNLIVYQSEKDYKLYVRPIRMFLEEVPKGKENPTKQEYRFMSCEELMENIF